MKTSTTAQILLLLFVPSLAAGQSLGEVARKAREQREAKAKAEAAKKPQGAGAEESQGGPPVQAPAKTYTLEDLTALPPVQSSMGGTQTRETAPSRALSPGAPSPSRSSTQATGESADERIRASQEAAWRERMNAARGQLEKATKRHAFLEGLTMVPNSSIVNRKTGETVFSSIEELQAATQNAKSAVEAAKREIEAIEEEARREDIPPGWLR